jgi:TDG/mug DNA glycosylase family protein
VILPDVLDHGLALVLCGTAPSRAARAAAADDAKPGNLFWPTLHKVGLTPALVRPADYRRVLDWRIGLTDLNKTEWGADAELSPGGFDVAGFAAKMRHYRPAVIAFDSKTAGRAVLGRPVSYGRQPETLGASALFVVPSPSGRARPWWDEAPWRELAGVVREIRGDA